MSPPDFFADTACTSRAHCRACRDREGGRPWRESLARHFTVPAVDFDCPHGGEWGQLPPARGLGDTVKRVIDTVTGGKLKPCGGCQRRREWLNRVVRYRKRKEPS